MYIIVPLGEGADAGDNSDSVFLPPDFALSATPLATPLATPTMTPLATPSSTPVHARRDVGGEGGNVCQSGCPFGDFLFVYMVVVIAYKKIEQLIVFNLIDILINTPLLKLHIK